MRSASSAIAYHIHACQLDGDVVEVRAERPHACQPDGERSARKATSAPPIDMFASNLLKYLVIMFFGFLILFHIYKNSPQLPSIKMFLIE
ncbi:unnamed protein product [Rhizophagus irregularis]|nr:unnamed protein product [Rhizophagus irregularis]